MTAKNLGACLKIVALGILPVVVEGSLPGETRTAQPNARINEYYFGRENAALHGRQGCLPPQRLSIFDFQTGAQGDGSGTMT